MSDSSITLAAAIGPTDNIIQVSAGVHGVHTPPFIAVIDTEAILVTAGTDAAYWSVQRGYLDSVPAAHTSSTALSIVKAPVLDRGTVAPSVLDLVKGVNGVAAGYKVARGVHTQVAASDTVVTGLATVIACVVSFQSAPTVKQLFCAADVGDQSGAPAAGSVLITTQKPTATGNVTPTAATDFSENLKLAWVAIGT